MTYTRYAVYYLPPPGPLADFGAAWLGWDPVAGERVAPPETGPLPRPLPDIVAAPRKYGLHATLKAPFRLMEDQDPAALRRAMADLAGSARPITLPGLGLARIGRFLALTPRGEAAALNALAARIVAELDRFRAPAHEAELTRRRAAGLSPREETNLMRWGYPYVMDAFGFHITLTGALDPAEIPAVEAELDRHLTPVLPRPFALDRIALAGEDADGFFRLIHRYTLTG